MTTNKKANKGFKVTKKYLKENGFSFITLQEAENIASKYKTESGAKNKIESVNAEHELKCTMPLPYRIEIEIEWKKSATWGANPTASVRWQDVNGWHWLENCASAFGCGYDKESTVVADCLNDVASCLLWKNRNKMKSAPYGVSKYEYYVCPTFCGGVGMSCYYRIAEWLGGKLEKVASSKSYDKYVFTFKK